MTADNEKPGGANKTVPETGQTAKGTGPDGRPDPADSEGFPATEFADPHTPPPEAGTAEGGAPAAEAPILLEERRSFRRPRNNALWIVLIVVVAFFIILLVYDTIRSRSQEKALAQIASGAADGTEREVPSVMQAAEQPGSETAAQTVGVDLPDDAFAGVAPIQTREGGALISEGEDAELAALADALNVRVRLLHGVKVRRSGDVRIETATGSFHGFRLTSVRSSSDTEVVRDEVTVTIPSGGKFVVKQRILEEIDRVDLNQVARDLKAASFQLVTRVRSEDRVVEVNLRRMADPEAAAGGDIGGSRLGDLTLGSPSGAIRRLIPPSYSVIKRKILVGDEFVFTYKVEDDRRRPLFYVYEENGRVAGIEVVSERFKTIDGIGIGSSVAEVRMNHSDLRVSATPSGITYLYADREGVKFVLAEDSRIDLDQPFVPFDVRITVVLIGRTPNLR